MGVLPIIRRICGRRLAGPQHAGDDDVVRRWRHETRRINWIDDDLGFKAVDNIYRMRDVHAAVLHLMGLNDLRLTYHSAGRNQRLTDTGGKVIKEVVA